MVQFTRFVTFLIITFDSVLGEYSWIPRFCFYNYFSTLSLFHDLVDSLVHYQFITSRRNQLDPAADTAVDTRTINLVFHVIKTLWIIYLGLFLGNEHNKNE